MKINNNCSGCQSCVNVCSVDAIVGGDNYGMEIDQKKCIKCHACLDVCEFDAVEE